MIWIKTVKQAAEYINKENFNSSLTKEDLFQEGCLAILIAIKENRVPEDEPHRSSYIFVRAAGAMRDARRKARNDLILYESELPEYPDKHPVDFDRLLASQKISNFKKSKKTTPAMIQVFDALIEGKSLHEIAIERKASISAVSRIVKRVITSFRKYD